MPNIKLRDGSGVETTYNNVDTITVPLADGSGTQTYGFTDEEMVFNNLSLLSSIPKVIYERNNVTVYKTDLNQYANNMFDGIEDCKNIAVILGPSKSNLTITRGFFKGGTFRDYPSNITLSGDGTHTGTYYSKGGGIDTLFQDCHYVRYLPDSDIFANTQIGRSYAPWVAEIFSGCHSLRRVPGFMSYFGRKYYGQGYNTQLYRSLFQYCYCLDEIVDLPVIHIVNNEDQETPATSDMFTNIVFGCNRLKNFTFETNNGEPIPVQWKSQTLNLNYVGYNQNNYSDNDFLDYNSGITSDKRIYNSVTYNALKNDPDAYVSTNSAETTAYDGKNVYTQKLYSRYNHTSAVNTINSLPDASAYLDTAGGTNTLQLSYYSGALTDEGGVDALTEQEIAVAVAKGWTVAFETSTS